MKNTELRLLTSDQLKDKLRDLYREALNLRFQKAQGALENPSRLRYVRRSVAKVQTFLKEQQLKKQ
ncbi:MAG: 50S ribosomal protein L29 [Holosporaceae bacterium]|jgi:large subunit ribosomal protein L29|nr:50S ribosomal protein L29 [Alphaproteobacteria bacterium]